MRDRWMMSWALVALLALVGCGSEDAPGTGGGTISGAQPKAAKIANDLVALIPEDTAALAYAKNPQELETKLRNLVRNFDPEASAEMQMLEGLGRELGPSWDPSKPMAMAIPVPAHGQMRGPEDMMRGGVMIFGSKDAPAFIKDMEEKLAEAPPERRPHLKASGNYVAMTMGRGPKPAWGTAPAFAQQMPEGDAAIRVDLAALVKRFQADIDDGLAQMEQELNRETQGMSGDMTAFADLAKTLSGWAKDITSSAEMLEIGMHIGDAEAEINFAFIAKDGSKLDIKGHDHTNLAKLASHLPHDAPINLLLSVDWAKVMEWIEPFMSAAMEELPADQQKGMEEYLKDAIALYKEVGPDAAMSLSIGDRGLEIIQVTDVKDGDAYLAKMKKLLQGSFISSFEGITVKVHDPVDAAGAKLHTFEIALDMGVMMAAQGQDMPADAQEEVDRVMRRIFGGPAMQMHTAVVGKKLVFGMGQKEAVVKAIESVKSGSGKASPALQNAIDKAGGTPTFLLQVDARMLMRQIMGLVNEFAPDENMPVPAAGKPIPVVIYGKHDGRVYGGGISADVAGIAELVELFSRR